MQQHYRGAWGRWLPSFVLAVTFVFAVSTYVARKPAHAGPSREAGQARSVYARLPLSFEENRGQTDARVKFLARDRGYSLFLTSNAAVLKLRQPSASKPSRFAALRIALKDSNPAPDVSGIGALTGKTNYYIGRDPNRWRTGIPTFSGVRLADVYPGVDLVYRGEQGRLEYDLELAPEADASRIEFQIDGARSLALDADRNLVIDTVAGNVIQHVPRIYQTIDGQRREVPGGYVLRDAHTVAFAIGAYDRSRTLVIDPLLTYASYLGGTGGDAGVGIAVDPNDGSAWIAGTTSSTDFPVTMDALQSSNFGSSDVFITKVSPDGSSKEFSTYAGGSEADAASGIAVDPDGNAFVTGLTQSSDFPISGNAFQGDLKGTQDAFVIAFDPGGGLIYSTLLGTDSAASAIAVDSASEAVVAGTTRSGAFPTTSGAFQMAYPGSISNPLVGFVTKLNFEGSGLQFSTFMGLSDGGWPAAVALDGSANVYLAGGTSTGVDFDAQLCAPDDCGFVVALNSAGTAANFSDIFPFATLTDVATDGSGNAHVIGWRGGPLLINLDGAGNPTFQMLTVGGVPSRLAIGQTSGNVFVTGVANNTSLAVTPEAYQSTYGGSGDGFVSVLDPSGFFNLYTTYLGGSGLDIALGVAVDPAENAYLTGSTESSDFPVTPGVFEGTYPMTSNPVAFVARIVPVLQAPTPTMTVAPTVAPTGAPTIMNPPTPTVERTPLPTHSTNATPLPTMTIPTPAQTAQGAGTPTQTIIVTATATLTPTSTPTATPTPIGTVRIAPRIIAFPGIKVGKESGFKVVVLTNPRSNKGPATITELALQSQLQAMPTEFVIDNTRTTCQVGDAIALGKTCRVYLRFMPATTGQVIDGLVINGNFVTTEVAIGLSGTGR
jgi:hypothetical protein